MGRRQRPGAMTPRPRRRAATVLGLPLVLMIQLLLSLLLHVGAEPVPLPAWMARAAEGASLLKRSSGSGGDGAMDPAAFGAWRETVRARRCVMPHM